MTNEKLHDCCREVTGSRCVQTSAWASCSGDDNNDDNDNDDDDNDNVQWHHHGGSPEHGQQRGQLLGRQPTSTAGGQESRDNIMTLVILSCYLVADQNQRWMHWSHLSRWLGLRCCQWSTFV